MYQDAIHWGGSIMERDWPRIQTLDKFIKENS